MAETVGGTATKYLVDSLNPTGYAQVLDELVSGAVTRTYAYGVQRISENQQISGVWTPSFYGYDGHGNVRFLTGTAGTATDTYVYDAFGLPLTSTGTTPNNYLYSGEQFDSVLGLYYLRARYYNPATGRFLTMDSYEGTILDPVTLHKYVYTQNNPVNASDPTGRGIFENLSIRANIFTQITVPLYLQTQQGKAAVAVGYVIATLALAERCELMELGEVLEDLLETGTRVKGPGINCNTQEHEPEPSE